MTDALAGASGRGNAVVLGYGATLFLSAGLLFSVEPMFAKLALPLLGGAPSVWSTATVFFQASLFLGYAYAHLIARRLTPRGQALVHLMVLALGLTALPFSLDAGLLPAPDASLYELRLLFAFAVALGLPFFALSANAPLLQRWFATSGHTRARDPYFLYATSNLGSVLALFAYPFLIEPLLDLGSQTRIWTLLYAVLILCIAAIGWSNRHVLAASEAPEAGAPKSIAPRWATRLRWLAASAVPSSLLIGVTAHISTNIAAMPLLWVLPLALYLFTFVLVFDRGGALPMRMIAWAFVFLLAVVLLFDLLLRGSAPVMIVLHLTLFFLAALICHADMAARRPPADRLTEFYMMMSAGGVIGGALTALVAPYLLPTLMEYPLMLVAAAAFLPKGRDWGSDRRFDLLVALGLLLLLWAISLAGGLAEQRGAYLVAALLVGFAALMAARTRPLRTFLIAAVCLFAVEAMLPRLGLNPFGDTLALERNFFGVSRVTESDTPAGNVHRYLHGDTTHNLQLMEPGLSGIPLAYYSYEGPFGDIVNLARADSADIRVAVIGLGAGAMACHARPGEDWHFFEIDPAVIDIATNPALFSFVSECAPEAPIVLGDARLTLAAEPDGAYDLIIVDAFSSDAIPAHLLTGEALALYRQKTTPDGLVFFHVSNRFADIASVVTATANAAGLEARYTLFSPDEKAPLASLKNKVAAVAVGPEARLDRLENWRNRPASGLIRPWSDSYSNIVAAIAAHLLDNGTQPMNWSAISPPPPTMMRQKAKGANP